MKQILILIIITLAITSGNAQTTDSTKIALSENNDSIYTIPEVYAQFPGGDKEWRSYLYKNLDATIAGVNGAKKGKYPVMIKFIVNQDGSIEKVEPETKFGFGMEAEAIRVISNGPKWIPAMHNGKVVRSYRHQPITFYVG